MCSWRMEGRKKSGDPLTKCDTAEPRMKRPVPVVCCAAAYRLLLLSFVIRHARAFVYKFARTRVLHKFSTELFVWLGLYCMPPSWMYTHFVIPRPPRRLNLDFVH